jgi:hypothetical protein
MLKRTALLLVLALALPAPSPAAAGSASNVHDFDWNFGTWKTHIKRLVHRLAGSTDWVAYQGVVTVRPLLGGKANIEVIDADGPSRLQLFGIRTYDPRSRQWIVSGAVRGSSSLEVPAYGTFHDGRGVFYDQEPFDNATILVRQTFFDITANSYAYEQAFSKDGGRTWEPNFRANLERTSSSVTPQSTDVGDGAHDFDFNEGTWRTHIRSLGGSAAKPVWAKLTGTVTIAKLWGGDAFVEELFAGGADGFSGVTLYLHDSQSHQWSQTYADSSDGTFESPMIGGFANGRGILTTLGAYDNRMVLQRGVWSGIGANAHRFQIEVSENGGTSWHPIFIASLTRLGSQG